MTVLLTHGLFYYCVLVSLITSKNLCIYSYFRIKVRSHSFTTKVSRDCPTSAIISFCVVYFTIIITIRRIPHPTVLSLCSAKFWMI